MIARTVWTLAIAIVWFAPVHTLAQAVDPDELRRAIQVQERNTPNLLALDGVVGTAVGLDASGRPNITVYTERSAVQGLPSALNGFAVRVEETGPITPLRIDRPRHHVNCDEPPWKDRGHCADGDGGGEEETSNLDPTDRWPRPVPIGVSTGHPKITAGTICCRVSDGSRIYALSNNHIYANTNDANNGDPVLQPGPYDGGEAGSDDVGWLWAWVEIHFGGSDNVADVAIADATDSSGPLVGTATPSDGYGQPESATTDAQLAMNVKKYGRTTRQTTGWVDGVNVTINVNYGDGRIARFVRQIAIKPGSFARGGDSGSLIVVDGGSDEGKPVGLLFAGGGGTTFANPIDDALGQWNLSIDGGP